MSTSTVDVHCLLCRCDWAAAVEPRRIEACPSCGLPTTVPPPSRDVFGDGIFLEGTYGGQRLAKREQWLGEARRRLAWVQEHVPAGRLLEVGSATGEFVSVAEAAGFDATGIEASAWAVEASRSLTGSVVRADVTAWLAERDERFDAIVLFHTLEHVHEPEPFLAPMAAALAPEGRLFVEVPNGEARDLRRGPGWCHASLDEHVVHYREQDLRRLLDAVGLEAQSVTTLTMKEFDSPLVWALRRARWLVQGQLAPSQDILRVIAAPRR